MTISGYKEAAANRGNQGKKGNHDETYVLTPIGIF